MIQIYHNPRCSKSRAGLQFLDDNNAEYEVINYIKDGISEQTILYLANKMNVNVIDLVRQNEEVYKTEIKGNQLTDSKLLKKIADNPRLLQRPIVVNNDKAVMGRPTEKIQEIL